MMKHERFYEIKYDDVYIFKFILDDGKEVKMKRKSAKLEIILGE